MRDNRRSDLTWLSHISESIEEAREYTAVQSKDPKISRGMQRAVERVLQTLAESTQRLTPELKATEPEIPWEKIAGLRNRLTHEYREVNQEIVRRVVKEELPQLESAARRMTERASSTDQNAWSQQAEETPAQANQQGTEAERIIGTERTGLRGRNAGRAVPANSDPDDPSKGDRRAEVAERIHRLRARHQDPAVRANAHLHLAGLEPDAEGAVDHLRKALTQDRGIADDAKLAGKLAERIDETQRRSRPIGREAAQAAAKDPQLVAQAREATERRPEQPEEGEAQRKKKHDGNTQGQR